MGSVTRDGQVNLDQAMARRNESFNVHHAHKALARAEIAIPQTHPSKIRSRCFWTALTRQT